MNQYDQIPRVRRFCARCRKEFFVIPAVTRRPGGGTFCSMACRRPHLTEEERFWSKVAKNPNGCWAWTGARMKTGYGGFGASAGLVRVHRFAWELANGKIPDGMCVLHRCDNRLCVRPDHLFLGTYQDNHDDMVAKGRDRNGCEKNRGERHGMAKLTAEKVLEIRRRYATEKRRGLTMALAREYGVNHRTIYQIVRRIVWTHV